MDKRTHPPEGELRKLLSGSTAAPWRPLLADRIHLRLCNRLCAIGVDRAMAELAFLFGKVASIGSGVLEIWSIPSGAVVETDLTPRSRAPKDILVPCAIIVQQDKAGRLLDVRFYFDPGPIFRRLQ